MGVKKDGKKTNHQKGSKIGGHGNRYVYCYHTYTSSFGPLASREEVPNPLFMMGNVWKKVVNGPKMSVKLVEVLGYGWEGSVTVTDPGRKIIDKATGDIDWYSSRSRRLAHKPITVGYVFENKGDKPIEYDSNKMVGDDMVFETLVAQPGQKFMLSRYDLEPWLDRYGANFMNCYINLLRPKNLAGKITGTLDTSQVKDNLPIYNIRLSRDSEYISLDDIVAQIGVREDRYSEWEIAEPYKEKFGFIKNERYFKKKFM